MNYRIQLLRVPSINNHLKHCHGVSVHTLQFRCMKTHFHTLLPSKKILLVIPLTKIFVSCMHAITCSLHANINMRAHSSIWPICMHVKNASYMQTYACVPFALILLSSCFHACIHIAHILHSYHSYTALISLIYCTHIAHILHSYCSYTALILLIYCTRIAHILHLYCSYTALILLIYCTHIAYKLHVCVCILHAI